MMVSQTEEYQNRSGIFFDYLSNKQYKQIFKNKNSWLKGDVFEYEEYL